MVFNSLDELKNYILTQSQVAIEKAQEKVAIIIKHFLDEYYKEFSPEVYIRTNQLLNSLVKSDIKNVGDGWVAEVYFDISKLDYSKREVPKGQPWSDYASENNTYRRNNWTKENDEWVLETAMIGSKPHGGYAGGTAIWTESMEVLDKQAIKILKEELIKAGIPVR